MGVAAAWSEELVAAWSECSSADRGVYLESTPTPLKQKTSPFCFCPLRAARHLPGPTPKEAEMGRGADMSTNGCQCVPNPLVQMV